MKNKSLTINEVVVRRFRGVRTPAEAIHIRREELCPGINIVFGPNASGKTTVAEAVQRLLWPDKTMINGVSIAGTTSIGDDDYHIDIEANTASFAKNGSGTANPVVVSSENKKSYFLALHQLLLERDTDLADRVRREINGGIDLNKAKNELGFQKKTVSTRSNEYKRYQENQTRLKTIRNEQADLADQEKQLDELRAQEKTAKLAKDRSQGIEHAIERQSQSAELAAVEKQLEIYPKCVANLTGDEMRNFEEYSHDLHRYQNERLLKADEVRDAEAKLDQSFKLGAKTDETLSELESLIDAIEKTESEIERLGRESERLKSLEQNSRAQIGDHFSEEAIETMEFGKMEDFSRLIAQARDSRLAERSLAHFKSICGIDESNNNDEKKELPEAINLLRRWLSVPEVNANHLLFEKADLIVLTAFSVVLGLFLAVLVHWSWLFATAAAIAAGLFFLVRKKASSTRDEHGDIEKRIRDLNSSYAPASWNENQVGETLTRLENEWDESRFAGLKRDHFNVIRIDKTREIEELRGKIEKTREELKRRYGSLVDDLDECDLSLTVNAIQSWRNIRQDQKANSAELEKVGQEFKRLINRFNTSVEIFGRKTIDDGHQAKALFNTIRNKVIERRELDSAIGNANDAITRLDLDIQAAKQRISQLFARIDLTPDLGNEVEFEAAAKKLRALLDSRADYHQILNRRNALKTTLEQLDAKRAALANFDEALLGLDISKLRELREQNQEQAETYDVIHDEIVKIETRIQKTVSSSALEEALSRRDEAFADLSNAVQTLCESSIGAMIVDYLKENTTEKSSGVFSRASELFSTFTHHQYKLRLNDDESEGFAAYDSISGRTLGLEQLSSGSRVQLLIAARLAFIETLETGGVKLPLVLDEILGNTDDRRASDLIETIIAIAKSGRQIFYMTAQADEFGKWKNSLKKHSSVELKTITLRGPRAEENFKLEIDRPEPIVIPAPENMSHEQYGERLRVPPIDRWSEDQGNLHLWYLTDDDDALWRLLSHGYERWGALATLLKTEGGLQSLDNFGVSDPALFKKKCEARVDVLKKALSLWRKGRNTPIDMGVVMESGAVTDKFRDDFSALLKECAGDPAELIARLDNKAINKFQTRKIDQLRDYLIEKGHLQEGDPIMSLQFKPMLDGFAADYIKESLVPRKFVDSLLLELSY